MGKKEIYKVKPLMEGKKNIIAGLLQEYDIQSTQDIQEVLKDLLGGTIQNMMDDEHLGYKSHKKSDYEKWQKDKEPSRQLCRA